MLQNSPWNSVLGIVVFPRDRSLGCKVQQGELQALWWLTCVTGTSQGPSEALLAVLGCADRKMQQLCILSRAEHPCSLSMSQMHCRSEGFPLPQRDKIQNYQKKIPKKNPMWFYALNPSAEGDFFCNQDITICVFLDIPLSSPSGSFTIATHWKGSKSNCEGLNLNFVIKWI